MRTPTNERVAPDIADTMQARTSGPAETRPSETGRGKTEPERKCVLTGKNGERNTLIRLVVSPDGLVLPDVQAKAPGRGAWIGVNRAELETAFADGKLRGALSRAFKTGALEIPDDLPHKIEQALTRSLLDRLGLELRVGALLMGSQRIADSARAGQVGLLCHASDASEDGMSKLDQAWRVGTDQEGTGARGLRLPLDRTALSVALGRENVVHIGVLDRGNGENAADRVMGPLSRLTNFIGGGKPPASAIEPDKAHQLDDKI